MSRSTDDASAPAIASFFGDGMLAFEKSPAPMYLVLTNGVVLKANRALRELLGYAEGEMPGRHASEFLDPLEKRRVEARLNDIDPHAGALGTSSYIAKRKDGSTVDVEVISAVIRDDDGAVHYIIGSARVVQRGDESGGR